MKILIACEYSGIVREAFRKRGHNAISCDTLPTEIDGPHIQADVRSVLFNQYWDMLIAFPPCTHLCGSCSRLWKEKQADGRQGDSIDFFLNLWNSGIEKIAIENPVGIMSTVFRKPDQIIQPNQYGHDASKKTCLWLRNLPKLEPTKLVPGRLVNGKFRWANQTDSGQNRLSPSETRAKDRSKTYPGIADAMAEKWG